MSMNEARDELMNVRWSKRFVSAAIPSISADVEVIFGVPGTVVRVFAMSISSTSAAMNFTVRSGSATGAGQQLTPLITLTTARHFDLVMNPDGWFDTLSGEGLYIDLVGSPQIDGIVLYKRINSLGVGL